MKILACNGNRPLAEAISKYLDLALTRASVRRFSDMEVFVEIHENVRGEDVFVIQSTSYPPIENPLRALRSRRSLWPTLSPRRAPIGCLPSTFMPAKSKAFSTYRQTT